MSKTCCSPSAGDGGYDLAVIGAGSAGFSAAITAADQGAQVALIGHGTIGGTCVNVGCVPSKALIRATEAVHHANTASRFAGITGTSRIQDWNALRAQKDELVASLRQAKYIDLLPAYNGVAYLEGKARLSKLAAPLIQLLPRGVYRELMMDALSQRTGLSAGALQNVLEQTSPAPKPEAGPAPAPPPPKQKVSAPPLPSSKRDPVLYMISLVLLHPGSASVLFGKALPAIDNPYLGTLNSLLELLRKRPESSTAMLLGHWQGQPEGEVLTLALSLDKPRYDAEKAQAALLESLQHLRRQITQRSFQGTVDKFRNANYADLSEEDKENLRALMRQKAQGD